MRTFLAVIASLGLVACVGGIEQPTDTQDPPPGGVGDGGDANAKQLFEDNVYPIISNLCVGCHNSTGPSGNVTGFVSTSLDNAYVTTTGYQAVVGNWTPDGAPIIQKIMSDNKTPSHQPITYSTDQLNKITEWLNAELTARGAGTGPTGTETPGQVTQRLLEEWSGCMTQDNFEAADMRQWGNVNTNEGQCKTCHNQGEYGEIASNTSTLFFPTITQDKYYMLQYFSVDLSQGVENAKIIMNDKSFDGVGNGLPPHQQHPRFNPTNNNGYRALQAFYTSTMNAKLAAPGGVCGPSKLLN
jgi:hypothetical protein